MGESISETRAYRRAYESEQFDLTDLIGPSDVIEGANHWSDISDEKLRREAYECIEYGDLNHEQEQIVFDRTFTLVKESLTRVIDSDVIEYLHEEYSQEELVANGMWTGDMSHGDLWEIIHDLEPWNIYGDYAESELRHIWGECRHEAAETVESAKADAINPRQEPRY